MKKIRLESNDETLRFDATLNDSCTQIIYAYGNEAKAILTHGKKT